MKTLLTKGIPYVIVALLCFFAGMFVGPRGSNAQSHIKQWRYTAGAAQKRYAAWDSRALFFADTGEPFADFVGRNDTFILYNWATWCPHCKKINASLSRLQSAAVPTVALTFDTDWDAYRRYREKERPFWRDLVMHDEAGSAVFTPREREFNVPLIPSVWIISNGTVKKIFVGEAGAAKLFPWLEKQGMLPAAQ